MHAFLDGSVHLHRCFVLWLRKPGLIIDLLYHCSVLFILALFCSYFLHLPSVSRINLFVYTLPSCCLCFKHTHAHTHSEFPHLLPFLSVLSPPLFLHSSLLPKDKRIGVSTSGGVCGGERSTQVGHGLL